MKMAGEGRHAGNLRTRLVHEPTGAEVSMDARREYRAESELFSVTGLVAGALASCALTTGPGRFKQLGMKPHF